MNVRMPGMGGYDMGGHDVARALRRQCQAHAGNPDGLGNSGRLDAGCKRRDLINDLTQPADIGAVERLLARLRAEA